MTLKDWLARHEMSNAEFARVSGIGQRALVQKYRHGLQTPSFQNLERIRKATGGQVTANDFVAQRVAASSCLEPAPVSSLAPKRRRRAAAPAPPPEDAPPGDPQRDRAA